MKIMTHTVNYCEQVKDADTYPRVLRKCRHYGITHCQKLGHEQIEDEDGWVRAPIECTEPFLTETIGEHNV